MKNLSNPNEISVSGALVLIIGIIIVVGLGIYLTTLEGALPMSPATIEMVLLAIIPFTLVGVIFSLVIFSGKRVEEIQAAAQELGLEEIDSTAELNFFEDLLYRTQINATGAFFISGLYQEYQNADFWICDVQVSKKQGKHSKRWFFTVVCVDCPKLNLPSFDLRPTTLTDRVKDKLGWVDINFSDNAAFSDMFHLSGSDEDAIREIFTEELMDFLETHPDLRLNTENNRLIFAQSTAGMAKALWLETVLLNGQKLLRLLKKKTPDKLKK
ncbi:MAG: hypothetical protein P1V97_06075 [Planctomycetota bacterium]|nr:hypothetical protein [Planctomycetota bacterium]